MEVGASEKRVPESKIWMRRADAYDSFPLHLLLQLLLKVPTKLSYEKDSQSTFPSLFQDK